MLYLRLPRRGFLFSFDDDGSVVLAQVPQAQSGVSARSLEERVTALERQLGSRTLGEHFREQAELIDQRFLLVDQRLSAIDQRLSALEQHALATNQRFDRIDKQFGTVNKDLATIRQGVTILLRRAT